MDSITNFYKNKKVLVTGATGFKGAWLCSWLLKLGAKVYGIGFTPNKNKNLFYSLSLDKKIVLRLFDIRDFKKLYQFINFSRPSIIFHLAGQPLVFESYKKPLLTFDINFRGTLNVLESSKNSKFVKSIVSITSDKCYENIGHYKKVYSETDRLGGLDPYSASKASAELIIKSYRDSFFKNKIKCGISSARAGNVIGGGDWSQERLIPDCIRFIIKKTKIGSITEPIPISGGILILKVGNKRVEETNMDLDKEMEKLIEIEKNKQLNNFSTNYFNQVKNNIKIKYFND